MSQNILYWIVEVLFYANVGELIISEENEAFEMAFCRVALQYVIVKAAILNDAETCSEFRIKWREGA